MDSGTLWLQAATEALCVRRLHLSLVLDSLRRGMERILLQRVVCIWFLSVFTTNHTRRVLHQTLRGKPYPQKRAKRRWRGVVFQYLDLWFHPWARFAMRLWHLTEVEVHRRHCILPQRRAGLTALTYVRTPKPLLVAPLGPRHTPTPVRVRWDCLERGQELSTDMPHCDP